MPSGSDFTFQRVDEKSVFFRLKKEAGRPNKKTMKLILSVCLIAAMTLQADAFTASPMIALRQKAGIQASSRPVSRSPLALKMADEPLYEDDKMPEVARE